MPMSDVEKRKAGFGAWPVFLTSISTILGAILFLRFGYSVGEVGFWGTIAIIMIGHLVTIPTALAVAEIATNQKVEGGGAYYIISRSFGLNIGAAVGIALYASQAISVAFYVIAFAEAFHPVLHWLSSNYGYLLAPYGLENVLSSPQLISIPSMLLLAVLMLTKGADLGVKSLYLVVAVLFISLVMFFLGNPVSSGEELTSILSEPANFHLDTRNFYFVFAIIFPAFTGMAAGIGLSGDLKDPKRSIPLGTIAATLIGMVIYVLVAYKLAISASREDLLADQLIMSQIAIWGPIIPIGLAAGCISSALGSIMIAPRTLQALANDRIFPSDPVNSWLAKGRMGSNEPVNSSYITIAIGFFFILIGDVNVVAAIIAMFFMVTYGAICLISFLEHFAADPSYRPTFKSKWYLSLIGAVLCIILMFQMSTPYALLSIAMMAGIYFGVTYYGKDHQGLATIFQGVIFQLSRQMQVFLQKAETDEVEGNWRPSVVCVSRDSFKRFAAFDLLRWISHRYGFGTYIHLIEDYLSKATSEQARTDLHRLIKMAETSKSNVYLDTMISPSYTSAIAQVMQLPGISGKDNNMLMFEFSKTDESSLKDIIDNYTLIKTVDFDVGILRSSERGFGFKHEIHIWITSKDYQNANLMILLGYIILGHPEWKNGLIKLFAIYPEEEIEEQKTGLLELITSGRLPISSNNLEVISQKQDTPIKGIVNSKSQSADLTIVGFRSEILKRKEANLFAGYEKLSNVLFVNSTEEKEITRI